MYYSLDIQKDLNTNLCKPKIFFTPVIKGHIRKPKKAVFCVECDNVNTAFYLFVDYGFIYQDNYGFLWFTEKFFSEFMQHTETYYANRK